MKLIPKIVEKHDQQTHREQTHHRVAAKGSHVCHFINKPGAAAWASVASGMRFEPPLQFPEGDTKVSSLHAWLLRQREVVSFWLQSPCSVRKQWSSLSFSGSSFLTIGPFFKAYSLANLQACLTVNASIPSTCSSQKSNSEPNQTQNRVDTRSIVQETDAFSLKMIG